MNTKTLLTTALLATSLDAQRRARNTSGGPLHPQQACFDVAHYELRMTVDPKTRSIDGKLTMTAQVTKATKHVFLHLDSQVVRLPNTYRVDPSNGLAGELRVLLGPEAVLA